MIIRCSRFVLYTIVVSISVWTFSTCTLTSDRIPVLIDADTANEVDDLFAIVRAISSARLDLIGLTSAQFHISPLATENSVLESQKINEQLLRLLNHEDLPHPIGANDPLKSFTVPNISPASNFIIKEAHKHSKEDPLHLVILGSCTNVASAIIQDSTIIDNIEVHYLGFWHDTLSNVYDKNEFNSGNDTLAIELLLNTSGLKMDVMTATTSQHLVFLKDNVDQHLKGKGGIADFLVERWESYDRWWTDEDIEKTQWTMWDVAIIEALIDPELANKRIFQTPEENTSREIHIYTSIDADKMKADYWAHLKKLLHLNSAN